MTYDASNRKDIRRAEKAAKVAEDLRLAYLKAAMTTSQGRQWFHDLLERCHIFADPFTGDPLREAYSKGERNIGLFIYADIVTHCPNDFITMMQEAHGRRTLDTIRNAPGADAPAERSASADPGWDVEGRISTEFDPYAEPDGAES